MKSGNIHQYAHLSLFHSLEQFNATIQTVLKKFGDQFTKGERLAFELLTRFSVKKIGICNARVCKLVEASQAFKGGLSRSTFERMLRKAKKLGIITIHHTIREKGGFSHNVYVFQRFDAANDEKLTERQNPTKADTATVQPSKTTTETTKIENKKIKEKDLRPISVEDLDYTYVPSYVPTDFTRTVKPFYPKATEICGLWDRATIAYRSQHFDEPIQSFLPIIIKAFKQTVFQYKQRKIKTSFHAYFYGAVMGMLVVEKRRMVAKQRLGRWDWLVSSFA